MFAIVRRALTDRKLYELIVTTVDLYEAMVANGEGGRMEQVMTTNGFELCTGPGRRVSICPRRDPGCCPRPTPQSNS